MNTIVFQGVSMSYFARKPTNIQLSFLRVRHLTAVSSRAVRVGYAECVLRVGIKPTFYYYLSKRTWLE